MNNRQTSAPRTSILVIDDIHADLRLLAEILTKRGYAVRPVPDGQLALSSAQAEPPDLILLDIVMAGMSGYEICERLKADERTRDIPVIFLSVLDEVSDKIKAFAVGGVDYITKPFQTEEVLARIETHLTLRNLRKTLKEKNAQLEAHNKELDAFAHTVAHDLKSPLIALVGYTSLIETCYAEMPEAELGTYLNLIARSGRRMLNIINELLLLASVRIGEEITTGPLDMGSVVSEAQGRLSDMIAKHQAEIIVPETWPLASGYGPWVEEVWVNYISNALQYGGRPPQVELGADQKGSEISPGLIRFWVRDNGAGLTPEEQARLFTPFTRLDQVRAKGHGLGLSIVRRIVKKLGGQVGVESEPGKGSTFWFGLPGVKGNVVRDT